MSKQLMFLQQKKPFPDKKIFLHIYKKNRLEKIAEIRSFFIEQKYLKKIEEGKCLEINCYL